MSSSSSPRASREWDEIVFSFQNYEALTSIPPAVTIAESWGRVGEGMNTAPATEIAPAQPRNPSRAARKRDERVRRVVRRIKKHATWLDQPHFATLLYTYGALWVRFVDLNSVKAEPIDDLGRPNAITDQLTRIAGRLGQLAGQLGLSPAAERALRHDAALEANHRKWIDLANAK